MAFGLGDNQKVTLGVVGTDEAGNQAVPPDGPFVWSIEDASLLAIEGVSEDTLRATVVALGPLGTTKVSVTDGRFTGIGEVTVVATEAISLTLVSGTPEHKYA